jgi:hypothetical protein
VRRIVLLLSAATIGLAAAPNALACGSAGYSYAGISSRTSVYGVGATLTSLAAPAVQNGHVAGWVGVGGPGLGPHGSTEWIQVGYSGFPGLRVGSLYYEVTLPGKAPTYHEVSAKIHPGERHRVAVLEVAHHLNWWRVWVDGHAASKPYHLPGSHGAWRGIATAESWGGGMRACNLYSYRFNRVAVAHHAGGNWKLVSSVYAMHQGDNRFVPRTTSSFVARTTTLPQAPQPQPRPTTSTATRGTTASRTANNAPTATTTATTSVTPTADATATPAGPPTTAVAAPAVDAAPPADPTVPVDPNAPGDPGTDDGHGVTP